MESEKVDRLGQLKGYQIAGLALVASTVAALAVVWTLRRLGILGPRQAGGDERQPAVPHGSHGETPRHFSEELLVPGMTFTGEQVAAQDHEIGRSPEGV